MKAANLELEQFLKLLRRHLPDLTWRDARRLPAAGQFNTALCLDQRWIFRFPKSAPVAAELAHELALLPRLRGKLPLPIPDPVFSARDPESGQVLFMGYAMLPGEPLLRPRFDRLRHDPGVVARIAEDLSDFLLALHRIPPDAIGLADQAADARRAWWRYYDEIRAQLYPHMRPDAQREVSRDFEAALSDAALWRYEACLTHGDFGTGNILVRAGRVSGIIDFSFCGFGDPAQDLGALLASYGEDFVAAVFRHYAALRPQLPRARFYRRQYALLQALFALRDKDQAEFEDGIAAYR